ncbi:RAM signaling pathway protein [Aspergillus rambellii]|uniref:RAM signaling pathway protein n=1 Tax=Aspergillus rambellii TaxID=308745 RepID=A0A0F8X8T1_9EURO|nr:RAM signaling pathway protein [Aspergillus rambellii]
MLSTMVRPEDTIRMPHPYREVEEDDGARTTPEPTGRSSSSSSNNDGSVKGEDEVKPLNGSTGDNNSLATKSLSGPRLLSQEETIELARRAVDNGIQETKRSLEGSEAVSDVVKPKLTIDLGHSNIARIPERVVDAIKDEVERLSLSNNYLFHIPYRFAECSHLRYLNIRANNFREFPKGVIKLPLLEILDLSRNKISQLPEEIKKLSSLRVLSVMQNRLDDLPLGISDMSKLQILKVAGNPLRYPLRRLLETTEAESTSSTMTDNEKEVAVTAELKRFLKTKQPIAPLEFDKSTDISEGVLDTPKPVKRGVSSRFPVIPSTGEGSCDPKSPSLSRPPPIPLKSHYRIASGHSGVFHSSVLQRPGAGPFPGVNERNRSNSEGIIQASFAARSKRMGLINRKNTDLGTLDEIRPYRNSHLRGLSHGSLFRTGPSASNSSSPSSPRERRRLKDGFVNRMSSLPEHKGELETGEPIIKSAKGILFALFQVQSHVSALINVIKRDDTRRNSLEIVFYNASTHVDRLNEALEIAENSRLDDADPTRMPCEAVKRECETCIMAYSHVGTQLRNSLDRIVAHGDPRYVRSLMLMIYSSVIELRNACVGLGVPVQTQRKHFAKPPIPEIYKEPVVSDRFLGPTVTPTRGREPSFSTRRFRSDTAILHPQITTSGPLPAAANYQSAVSSPGFAPTPFTFGARSRSSSRSNHINTSVPSSLATPRSGESFPSMPTSVVPRINPLTGLDEIEEERIFEKIFYQLTSAYTAALQALPLARRQFVRCLELAEQTREFEDIQMLWHNLIRRCRVCLEVSEALGLRLSNMKVKEPGGGMRNQREFWQLCKAFMQSFVDLVTDMREVRGMHLLPSDIIVVLRPVQRASREAGRLIEASPWSYLADLAPGNAPPIIYGPPLPSQHQHHHHNQHHHPQLNTNLSPQSVTLPATPLSAALGPAAQATVPSTPASAYSDKFFEGDVFQRADSLLSMPNQAPFFTRR